MANDYPILMLPEAKPVDRSTRSMFVPAPRKPSADDNWRRLEPTFSTLQKALDGKKVHLQQSADMAVPEDVLVLETVGRIDDFYKAIAKVGGLEWMLEEDRDIQPDEDFYYPDEKGKPTTKELPARLYLVSTNSEALRELVSLFQRYGEKLPRGYAKFRDVFKQLHAVRFWNYEDRLDGMDWEAWLNGYAAGERVKFQVELWYRNNENRRKAAQQTVVDLVQSGEGKVLKVCDIPEIRYHALLVEMPVESLRALMNNLEEKSLIKCSDVMFFKAMPQMAWSFDADDEAAVALEKVSVEPLPNGSPIVALLDGCPMENHSLLEKRIVVDDADGYNDGRYLVSYRRHGTQMASLIIHGDMSNAGQALDTPLYVRPIMQPNIKGAEQIPEDILLVDLIHRAVKRMKRGENGNPPAAPDVKIINFSIGDKVRMFVRSMSPLARLLDWMSYEYEVLFVISGGNSYQLYPTDCPITEFKGKTQEEISKHITFERLKNNKSCRILSPAESINNLTVGSVHSDESVIPPYPVKVNPYDCLHPAIYTPFGGGLKKSIKPDLVYVGGRQLLEEKVADHDNLYPSEYKSAPGLWAAWPDDTRRGLKYDRGTSGTAALISRAAYNCYRELVDILNANGKPETHIHLLIKALVVHGCSWDKIADNIERFLPNDSESKKIKQAWIGYGYPDFEKSLSCNPSRVTVLGFGELKAERAHEYSMPLPPSLSNRNLKRRLTVTLSWMSGVSPENQRYRKTKMWVEVGNVQRIIGDRIDVADNWATRRGTLQHEVFEGDKRFTQEENATLKIKVNCAEDAGKVATPVKYALAVTLEVGEGVPVGLFNEIDIYQEVRDRLTVKVPVTPMANI